MLKNTSCLVLSMTIFFIVNTASYAKEPMIGVDGGLLKGLKQLDVFLIKTIPNIEKGEKTIIDLKVMNFGIHQCTLHGQAWQEDTTSFQALLVETEYLLCGTNKYPAHFYSRVIFDQRLSLNSNTPFGSFAKSGLELFLIKTKSHKNRQYNKASNVVLK